VPRNTINAGGFCFGLKIEYPFDLKNIMGFIFFSVAVKKAGRILKIKKHNYFDNICICFDVFKLFKTRRKYHEEAFQELVGLSHFFCWPSRQESRSEDMSNDDNMVRKRTARKQIHSKKKASKKWSIYIVLHCEHLELGYLIDYIYLLSSFGLVNFISCTTTNYISCFGTLYQSQSIVSLYGFCKHEYQRNPDNLSVLIYLEMEHFDWSRFLWNVIFIDPGTINGAMLWQLVWHTCIVYIDFKWRFFQYLYLWYM